MKRALTFLATMTFILQAPALASDVLSGHVEHRSALTRVNRPAMPSRPLGDALDQAGPHGSKRKSSVNLAGSVASILDKNSFDFKYNPETGRSEKTSLDGKASDSDKQMAIAWEAWYKRVQSNLYQIWQDYGNVAGYADISVRISKDGDLFDFAMQNYRVDPHEHVSPKQEELFERNIERTLSMLAHTDILTFPAGSKRQSVPLRTSFSLSENGDSGFDWKKDDIEIVPSHR